MCLSKLQHTHTHTKHTKHTKQNFDPTRPAESTALSGENTHIEIVQARLYEMMMITVGRCTMEAVAV